MRDGTYENRVTGRAEEVKRAIVDRGAKSVWNLHAFLALDAANDDDIVDAVNRSLSVSTFSSNESVAGGPFHVLPSMLLAAKWYDRLPDAAMERIRRFFVEGVIDRGNTENHWLMHYTGNLLAAEMWNSEPVLWNGLRPEAVHAEAKRWIIGMVKRTVLTGHHEYDSTGYIAEHVTPLIGLVEYAVDDEVREYAEKALTLLFADMALEYFHGAWAGGHSREGYRVNTWTKSGTVRGLHYLYFGNEPFDPAAHVQGFVAPNLVAAYRPPEIVVEMAFDRDEPFTVRKTKAPRTIYRHVEREAEPVRKYTYMSTSFALGSTQLGLPGPPAAPIDLVSWDLTWSGPKHDATIVANHPYRDPKRFSAFLPMLPQTAGRSVATGKPYLQWPDRLYGASPFERMMQYEGTIIVLYRIPDNDDSPFVNLYLPKSTTWHEQSGWLFGEPETDVGGFYVGVRIIGAYNWHEIREATSSNIMVRDGDLIDGWLLRVESRHAGVVLEAVEADRFESLEAYAVHRTAHHVGLGEWPEPGKVSVETWDGVGLEMSYDGPHLIDGRPVDYDAYPLLDAPWVDAPLGRGIVSFERDGKRLEVDFETGSDHELIPMRVIG